MSISATLRRAGPYSTNGSQTVFPFAFKVFEESHVAVSKTTDGVVEDLVFGTDFTVALNADQDASPGGSVTISPALASGSTINIVSQAPYEQPTQFSNQGGFYPSVLNDALDRAAIQTQQLVEKVARVPSFPIGVTPVDFASLAGGEGKFLKVIDGKIAGQSVSDFEAPARAQAERAEAAADIAVTGLGAPDFTTVALGRAGTDVGDLFIVPSGPNGAYDLWRHDAVGETLIARHYGPPTGFKLDTTGAFPVSVPYYTGLTDTFLIVGDSIARGYGNSIGDPSPSTTAYEVEDDNSLTYPMADPVGDAIGGSFWPAFANEWGDKTGNKVAIVNEGVGSSYLLAAGGAANWSPTGALRSAAKDRINSAVEAIRQTSAHAMGNVYVVIYLGTNDAVSINGTTITGPIIREKYNELFDYFKAEVPGLAGFLVYQIGDDNDGAPVGPPHINDKFREVRDAIEDAVALEPLARIVSRAARSQAYDAANRMWDQVHYNQTANNLLGLLGAREATKATPTVPTAPTLLASTLYEDTDVATATSRTQSHTTQAGCKALLVFVAATRTGSASAITLTAPTFDGVSATLLGQEVNTHLASNSSPASYTRVAAYLLLGDFDAVTADIVATASLASNAIHIAVCEFDSAVIQEAGFGARLNGTTGTSLGRDIYTANPGIACLFTASAAAAAAPVTHTFTNATEVDEGGQSDGATVSAQAALATATVAMNTALATSVTFSSAVRAAVLSEVVLRRKEDGE